MAHLRVLPRLLLNLPFWKRLGILLLFWLPIVLIYSPGKGALGSLFVIPVALAAWLFKYRGGLIFTVIALIEIAIADVLSAGSLFLPHDMMTGIIFGAVALLTVASVIGFQRSTLDIVIASRQQLVAAYEQQRQLNGLKDQFLLNVSHELRTPLTEVQGYLELLQSYQGKLDPAMQMTFVNHAVHGCEELQLLISNVLDAMHLENYEALAQAEELNIADVVDDVLKDLDPCSKEEHPILLKIPEVLVAWAIRKDVYQVLRNLLSNAFKYSSKNAPVLVQASLFESAQPVVGLHQVCISVKDAGLGIPPDEISLLFGRLVRLKRDVSGPIRGSGLGLYICKQLVEGMGGKIWVESSGVPGEGSCFRFTLPRVPCTKGASLSEGS